MLNGKLAKSLSELSVYEVSAVLEALKLGKYKETLLSNEIDGKCLMKCHTVEDVKEMGIPMTVKASLLLDEIRKWKTTEDPMEYFAGTVEDNAAMKADSQVIYDAAVDSSNYDDDDAVPTI